jgi:hypothetical protein
LAHAKIPPALTLRCKRSSRPLVLDNRSLASSTNFWSKKRLIVRPCPMGVHWPLNRQPSQASWVTR